MPVAPLPPDDANRLRSLRNLGILDSPPDPEFDALVQVASLVCGMPISLLSLVDEDRQWFKANVGLAGTTETPRDVAFCAHTILSDDVLEVPDATHDPRFADNPLVLGEPGIRFYAGAPLRLSDGTTAGTLCVIGREPGRLDAAQRAILHHLARVAVSALENWRTRAEQQQIATELARAKAAAEQANLAKSRFLASMSHELRTPLHGLLGYAQLLRVEGKLNNLQEARITAMMQAGDHLLEMINSVLDITAIEAGHVTLRRVPCDAWAIAAGCLNQVRPVAEAKGLALHLTATPGTRADVMADHTRLRQILFNLLGNAVKFTSAGSVELRLIAVDGGSRLRIAITDSGPGITAAHRPLLFREFERGGNDAVGATEGAGIGLALSARLAALMGGRIGYDPNPAGGSVFWLELPVADDARAVNPPPAPSRATVPAATRKLHVLVVDDVAQNREIAAAFLASDGHRATCVEGGREAVAAVAGTDFDVVLMDVRMPEMDGLEATRRIRALGGQRARVPIVSLTAQAFTGQIEACRRAGMDGHLAKPFTPDTLNAAVQGAFTDRSRQPARPAPSAEPIIFDRGAYDATASYLSPQSVALHLNALAEKADTLLRALRAPDALARRAPALSDLAHTLAGMAGMYGFVHLGSLCRRFERAVDGGGDEAAERAPGLIEALELTLRKLPDVLRERA